MKDITDIKKINLANAGLGAVGSGHAQPYPSKPIKIIAGYPAGGQTDLYARTYGEYIRSETGQNVTVENKAGASGSEKSTTAGGTASGFMRPVAAFRRTL